MVILPMVGLAIDLTMMYILKVKLLTALDAGMLAAARALGQGADPSTQAQNARLAAAKFFAANFPTGYWGTSNLSFPAPAIDSTTVPNYRSITGTASVDAPLYFLRVFGASTSTLRVSAQAARRDALVVLVLDRSGSMDRGVAGTGTTACEIMKQDAKEFMQYFAPGRDKLALVVFNSGTFYLGPRTNFNPSSSSDPLVSAIDSITCKDNTGAADALHRAYDIITTNNETSRANVIVFMTDGIPNGISGNFISYRISPCGTTGTPMIGVLAQWANNQATGTTAGLMARSTTSVSADTTPSQENTGSCRFKTPTSDPDLTRIDEDVTRMPTTDVYNNALAGTYSSYLNDDVSFFGSPAVLTRVDRPQEITKASANALDNQATVIRTNTTFKPMIYTIGLNTDPTGLDRPDEQLLKKIANDPSLATSPNSGPQIYQNQINQPRGIYVNAPDASQLGAAFETIATHIVVRLAL
jgi:hypothetical protein